MLPVGRVGGRPAQLGRHPRIDVRGWLVPSGPSEPSVGSHRPHLLSGVVPPWWAARTPVRVRSRAAGGGVGVVPTRCGRGRVEGRWRIGARDRSLGHRGRGPAATSAPGGAQVLAGGHRGRHDVDQLDLHGDSSSRGGRRDGGQQSLGGLAGASGFPARDERTPTVAAPQVRPATSDPDPMTTADADTTDHSLDARVSALETGASSWAALVGEDVRRMRQDLDALQAEVTELRARLDG